MACTLVLILEAPITCLACHNHAKEAESDFCARCLTWLGYTDGTRRGDDSTMPKRSPKRPSPTP